MPLFLLFLIVPVVEIMVLIKVGSWLGLFWTLLLILSTAVIGINILRQQGVAVLTRAGQKLNQGGLPAQELAEGFLLALAGALLITPGLVTDCMGFSLLVPSVRQSLVGAVVKFMQARMVGGAMMGRGFESQTTEEPAAGFGRPFPPSEGVTRRPDVIDGEYRRED